MRSLTGFGVGDVALGGGRIVAEIRSVNQRFLEVRSRLPRELIEAARMDNCGYIKIYWFITLPLSLPIIATVGVWNHTPSPLKRGF